MKNYRKRDIHTPVIPPTVTFFGLCLSPAASTITIGVAMFANRVVTPGAVASTIIAEGLMNVVNVVG